MAMSSRFQATYPGIPTAVRDIRGELTRFAARAGFDDGQLDDIRIAVSEAATNAVVHAYAERRGEIRVVAGVDRGELVIAIADDGPGMVARPDSPGLGLGLPTITTVSDRVEVASTSAGCELQMAFRLPPAPCLP
jgi:anti-sigma regulatory factor (Ser/Thr protein kinase)